jgi:putative flippase GtrA
MKGHEVKIKFLIVGLWNTVFGYAVFVGLDFLFTLFFLKRYVAYMLAAVLSNILAIINAYIFHKFVTFRSPLRGIAIVPEFLRFFSMYLFSFCLGLVLLPVFVELFHLDPKISVALLIPITTIISYFGHSRFSFKLYPKNSVRSTRRESAARRHRE